MKVKVLEKTAGCFPVDFEIGDWFDLFTAEEVTLGTPHANMLHKTNQAKKDGTPMIRTRDVEFSSALIPLGVAMEMPKGTECHLLPRSSTFKKYGLIQTNSMGIIDRTYASDKDEWKLPVIATRKVTIPKGTRIAQFRVVPSQKASFWQKLRWLFSNGVRLKPVAHLNNPERKGFGEGTRN